MLLNSLFEESNSIDDEELRFRLTMVEKVLTSLGSDNNLDMDTMMDFYRKHGSAFVSVMLARAMITVDGRRNATYIQLAVGFDGERWTIAAPDIDKSFVGEGSSPIQTYFDVDDEANLIRALKHTAAEVKDKIKKFKPKTDLEKAVNFKVVDWYKK